MSPKEKAEQLYERFSNTANSFIEGKRCALICVDEILENKSITREYLEKVKQELEKL